MEFYSAKDIVKFTGLSVGRASAIIQEINKDLRDQGYRTIKGRVSKHAFEKAYGKVDLDTK